ncbi:LytTR family DNA-binding domain-containing protein [Xanthomonas cassavae CFBP 4642]|uniref:LytTR family DNA-binding domain-containing protein n=1 Tax=Xanthomonas cassavae CFBP 4642 TaxID=1219375 RepID=A0ABS8HID5_9XANT|nr:LytTR family DNA-binding domain-containing protein [Xanthomonas cassavae]MCC4621863.1 LytTR family DNA-binding domain-containing protein [Xanthomonas cassavae CFBP 4642]
MIEAVIVEDSELARFELEHQLKGYPQLRVIGHAGDVETAVALIESAAPAVVFLDIDLPGGTAFDVLQRLSQVPRIIFTTAFDVHALKAFGYNTVDYLLKPIEPLRLAQAIAKLGEAVPATPVRRSMDVAIFIKDGEQCFLVKPREIRAIEAVGNYSRVYFQSQSPMLYRPLGAIEMQLAPDKFFRASRKYIVNLDFVEQVAPWSNGGLMLTLRGGLEVEISRRQSARFREMLSL